MRKRLRQNESFTSSSFSGGGGGLFSESLQEAQNGAGSAGSSSISSSTAPREVNHDHHWPSLVSADVVLVVVNGIGVETATVAFFAGTVTRGEPAATR